MKIKCPLEIETEHGCICEGATAEQNWTVCRPRECKVAAMLKEFGDLLEVAERLCAICGIGNKQLCEKCYNKALIEKIKQTRGEK